MKVSAIIPAFNAGPFIAQAIESVLAQTLPVDEIVVVDDGSTDDTAAIAMAFSGIHCIRQRNQGPPTARNAGLHQSTGDLIGFLDADDIWPCNKTETQAHYLEEHPGAGCVVARMKNFLDPGIAKPDWIPDSSLAEGVVALALQGSLIHRWVFDHVGDFNTTRILSDDLDWFIRVREAGIPIGFMDSVMVHRRIHATNISRNQRAVAVATLRILKDHLDRKRGRQTEA